MFYIYYILSLFTLGSIILINKNTKVNKYLSLLAGFISIAGISYIKIGDVVNYSTTTTGIINILTVSYLSYIFTLGFGIILAIYIFHSIASEKTNYKEISLGILYATSGIVLASLTHLFLIFIFIEIMSITAIFIILQNNQDTKNSIIAAKIYTLIHILSGSLLLVGIIFYLKIFNIHHILKIDRFDYIYQYFILIGLLINLALPPFSIWLTKGYSNSSPNSSILLSAFTTKVTLLLLLKFFSGLSYLIYIGIYISIIGLILSLLTPNIREILAYSIIQSLGIIIILISISTNSMKVAISLTAYSNIIYKSLYFLIISLIINQTQKYHLNDLRGILKSNPFLSISIILLALTSLGFPLTGNYLGKSIIATEIHKIHNPLISYSVQILTALFSLNIALRLPYILIFQKPLQTVNKINLTRSNIAIITIGLISLQLPYILSFIKVNLLLFNFSNILHALEIFLIGVIIFMAVIKLLNKIQGINFNPQINIHPILHKYQDVNYIQILKDIFNPNNYPYIYDYTRKISPISLNFICSILLLTSIILIITIF
jgi:multicomponent Na+:H+ antiporter subunit D